MTEIQFGFARGVANMVAKGIPAFWVVWNETVAQLEKEFSLSLDDMTTDETDRIDRICLATCDGTGEVLKKVA